MAEALAALGTTKAWVVHGRDGIDELSIAGASHVCEVENGAIREFEIHPADAADAHAVSLVSEPQKKGTSGTWPCA